jgi:hypothetical protein
MNIVAVLLEIAVRLVVACICKSKNVGVDRSKFVFQRRLIGMYLRDCFSRATLVLALLTFVFTLSAVAQARDHGIGGVPPGNCFNNSAHCMIAAGTKYISALVTQDPSDVNNVPFAPDCKRRENAANAGDNAEEIRNIILSRTTPVFGPRDLRWFVDEHERVAIAYFLLDIGSTMPQPTAHIAEKFAVESGQIKQIEAIFVINDIPNSGF